MQSSSFLPKPVLPSTPLLSNETPSFQMLRSEALESSLLLSFSSPILCTCCLLCLQNITRIWRLLTAMANALIKTHGLSLVSPLCLSHLCSLILHPAARWTLLQCKSDHGTPLQETLPRSLGPWSQSSPLASLVAVLNLNCSMAGGILVPPLGIKPASPALEGGFLTSGPPGKSLGLLFISDILKFHDAVFQVGLFI